ncbi:DUF1788 domain-containing protein [Mesorhizobium sp. LSJC264A00]|uniref:DUF1788 domain-containing protein n=1 Tax=unclassified Mesorhizobium TaxID=325217 RepID=UPI0003CE7A08|nr:DUF1788 domain-containing protein [Mesorhizobium sp. LSJC264A00]ESX24130.1 hypothetical protein X767_13210 [Mesorhizobium sp. LSJC264A00]
MTNGIHQAADQKRFDHLLAVLSSERFLKMRGIGNEVPFFICPFETADGIQIERLRTRLASQLANRGVTVLEFNLYDLAIELLKERGIWEDILAAEQGVSKDELRELLQGVLDPETHLVPAIDRRLREQQHDILFLSGVGEVFPYIRSHNVLNNLQSVAKEKPTLMFFPGNYSHALATGASLELFGMLHDDKYYRAFNIFHYEV